MSVAFRRESDDEHLEPKFELPIPVGPNRVTERGLTLLREKLAEVSAAVAAETDEEALKKLRREQRYWSTQAASAQVQPAPEEGVAGIGSTVTVRRGTQEQRFTIVGHDEADPAAGLIAFTAPLARAVRGAGEGERVAFGGVEDAVEVLEVRP
jgi:transcription elongation GreA/GreB family factor